MGSDLPVGNLEGNIPYLEATARGGEERYLGEVSGGWDNRE
jgi:hypothetical protein